MIGTRTLRPAALTLLLAACATAPTSAPAPAPAPAAAATGPALAMVANAPPGGAGLVNDPALGGQIDVNVLTAYAAASGRACKRVAIRRTADGAAFSRVACLGPNGWYWTAASIT